MPAAPFLSSSPRLHPKYASCGGGGHFLGKSGSVQLGGLIWEPACFLIGLGVNEWLRSVRRAGLGTGACNLIAAWCSEHCTSLWSDGAVCAGDGGEGQRRCSQHQQASALSLEVWEHFRLLVASPRDHLRACCPEKVAERRRLVLVHPQHWHPGGINKFTASQSGTEAHGDILHPARPPSAGKCRPASMVQTSYLVALQTPLFGAFQLYGPFCA